MVRLNPDEHWSAVTNRSESSTDGALAFWLLSAVSFVTDQALRRIQIALSITGAQTASDYGKATPTYSIAGSKGDIPEGRLIVPIVFAKDIQNPGDLAWHSFLDGRPFAMVLADPDQVAMADVEEGAGHESDETIVDPPCDIWMPLPDGGKMPFEVDDGVQGDRMMVDIGSGDPVTQSNHVLLPWWGLNGVEPGTKLDAMGLCTYQREIRPGGYAMPMDASGNVHQIGPGPAAYKSHPAFRHGCRLAQAHSMGMKIRLDRQ